MFYFITNLTAAVSFTHEDSMYHLFGLEEIIKTIYALSHPYIVNHIETIHALKSPYHSWLSHVNNKTIDCYDTQSLFVINNLSLEESFIEEYKSDSMLDDKNQSSMIGGIFSIEEKERQIIKINSALNHLKIILPEHYELFNLVISHIIFRKSDSCGGGSVSSVIGLLWLNIKEQLTIYDVLELLIHELTHNLLFIDERRYGHYNYDAIALQHNYAVSAILKETRPLDKVIHSIVVAAEIILSRRKYQYDSKNVSIHLPTDKMIEQIAVSIQSVMTMYNIEKLLSVRVFMILNIISKKLL